MTQPSDIIYDLTLEAANGPRPVRVYIKFHHHDRYIVAIKDPLTQQDLEATLEPQQLEEAVQLFKWAVANDPDPIAPAIRKFIKSI